ncbi:MAG TPA: type II toxin-antitoxin system VapC family toxin [Allosphingosinicella sp.]
MILLDTQILIWLAEGDTRLRKAAREAIEQVGASSRILVSAASFWETGLLLSKGRITLSSPLATWASAIASQAKMKVVPVDADIAVEAGMLPGDLHGDPGDRFLVATARVLNVPLLTTDRKILAYAESGRVDAVDARR